MSNNSAPSFSLHSKPRGYSSTDESDSDSDREENTRSGTELTAANDAQHQSEAVYHCLPRPNGTLISKYNAQ